MVDKSHAQLTLRGVAPRLGWYRHHKGGLYLLFAAGVDEATGEHRVAYFSAEKRTRWFRTLPNWSDFLFRNDPADPGKPRFAWHGPASDTELLAALKEWP